jgi:hypothetical protein
LLSTGTCIAPASNCAAAATWVLAREVSSYRLAQTVVVEVDVDACLLHAVALPSCRPRQPLAMNKEVASYVIAVI